MLAPPAVAGADPSLVLAVEPLELPELLLDELRWVVPELLDEEEVVVVLAGAVPLLVPLLDERS